MKNEKPATFMSNPYSISMGHYPEQWTQNERIVYEELKGKDWTLGSVLQKSISTLSMHTVNNSLRRLLNRGVVERKEDTKLKRVLWRVLDGE